MEKLIGKFKEEDIMNAGKVFGEYESLIFLEAVQYIQEDDTYLFDFMEKSSGGFSSVESVSLSEDDVRNWIKKYEMH